MTNIFTAISGQFSKSLILGAFFPVTVFVLLVLCLLPALVPASGSFFAPLSGLDPQWKVFAVTLAILLLSGLLFNLNTALIRLYEGYPWKDSRFGKKRTAHTGNPCACWDGSTLGPTDVVKDMKRPQQAKERAMISGQLIEIGSAIKTIFLLNPLCCPPVLETSFEASENYPRLQYGMSAVPLWPRLTAVIPKDYAVTIDDSKNRVGLPHKLFLPLRAAGL